MKSSDCFSLAFDRNGQLVSFARSGLKDLLNSHAMVNPAASENKGLAKLIPFY